MTLKNHPVRHFINRIKGQAIKSALTQSGIFWSSFIFYSRSTISKSEMLSALTSQQPHLLALWSTAWGIMLRLLYSSKWNWAFIAERDLVRNLSTQKLETPLKQENEVKTSLSVLRSWSRPNCYLLELIWEHWRLHWTSSRCLQLKTELLARFAHTDMAGIARNYKDEDWMALVKLS